MSVPDTIADVLPDWSSGSGSSLPLPVLVLAGVSTAIATVVSTTSIVLHLRNYRKPILQRMVIRIMLMVPIYAIASLISLFSLQAAFFIDVVRDIYEAFVIYCFFDLMVAYLGGERSLLINIHGRPPKYPVFPGNLLWREVDVSDPHTFLFLKRGVLQYVQVKPVLALITIITKALGKYNEGDLRANSGYLYVSIVYNFSICMALYCLAIFWMCVNDDLKPFRPLPKFLCVKGILFFSFWQSLFISILVAAGAIKKLGPYTDNEHISLGLTDLLVCLEMPFFAIAHQYAFSTTDFIDPYTKYVARMRMSYAFHDAFSLKDVVEDTKATLHGEGMDYRDFEPSEGFMHQGAGRERRIRAGLRYSQGGKRKYWLPQPATSSQPGGSLDRIVERFTGHDEADQEVYAPLLPDQADSVVHLAPDLMSPNQDESPYVPDHGLDDLGYDLPFGDPDEGDDELFLQSKQYLFGDYNYPVVDVSSEHARKLIWIEEERILRDERGAWFSPTHGPSAVLAHAKSSAGYGATGNTPARSRHNSNLSDVRRGTPDVVSPSREALIDKEQGPVPDMGINGLNLRWTHLGAQSPGLFGRVRTLSNQGKPGPSAASSPVSSEAGSPRPRPSPRKETERAALPPDAVDLVVEDPDAAQAETTWERRKGEPAGLHKVYRRGYTVDEDGQHEEGEVEVEDARGAQSPFAVGDDIEAVTQMEENAVEEMTATRAETPPPHARITVSHFQAPSEENPWA